MNARYPLVVLLAVLLTWSVQAQRVDPAVVAVSGGFSETAAVSLSWTVGQTAVETRTAQFGTLTEGFQQSYLTVIPMRDRSVPFSLSLFPNPVRSSVLVSFDGAKEDMTLMLYNLLGEVVLRHDVRGGDRIARLSIENFPSGIYMLAAIGKSGDRLALYKIVKAQ